MDPIVICTRSNRESRISRSPSPSPSSTRPQHQPKKKSWWKTPRAWLFGSLSRSLRTLLGCVTLIAFPIMWASGYTKDGYNLSLMDALFATISGITGTGFNSVEMTRFSYAQLVMQQALACGTCLFSLVSLISVWNLGVSWYRMSEDNMQRLPRYLRRPQRLSLSVRSRKETITSTETLVDTESTIQTDDTADVNGIELEILRPESSERVAEQRSPTDRLAINLDTTTFTSVTSPNLATTSSRRTSQETPQREIEYHDVEPYLPGHVGKIEPNSEFTHMDHKGREELQFLQFCTYCFILAVLMAYFVVFIIIAGSLSAYLGIKKGVLKDSPFSPSGTGFCIAVSAFSNSGFFPLDAGMALFSNDYAVQLVTVLLTLAGNAALPLFFRMSVWLTHLVSESLAKRPGAGKFVCRLARVSGYLLDHPRRSFLYMFPSKESWWLALILVVLSLGEMISTGLSENKTPVFEGTPKKIAWLQSFSQSIYLKSTGFQVISLSLIEGAPTGLLPLSMVVSAVVLNVISHNTNPFESRVLDDYKRPSTDGNQQRPRFWKRFWNNYVQSQFFFRQIRKQMAPDVWKLALLYTILASIVKPGNESPVEPLSFTFELASAYGNVGLSMGAPGHSYSLCGSWSKAAKVVICAAMLLGKCRGLPDNIDRAFEHVHDRLDKLEQEDGEIRDGIRDRVTAWRTTVPQREDERGGLSEDEIV